MATADEGLIRHIILNSLRMHNLKFRDKYGEMYICCDHGSWRKDVFPEYKAKRKIGREKSDIDWPAIYKVLSKIQAEIDEFTSWHVLDVPKCEADDIIGYMVELNQDFGNTEQILIISNDKDFLQLQRYNNITQYAPVKKRFISDPNPREYLMNHILRGDTGDGVPNILSDNDSLINPDKRQKQLQKKRIAIIKDSWDNLESILTVEELKNFYRNQTCIDLLFIPDSVKAEIRQAIGTLPKKTNMKLFNYLVKNKCRQLLESINDFYTKG